MMFQQAFNNALAFINIGAMLVVILVAVAALLSDNLKIIVAAGIIDALLLAAVWGFSRSVI